MRANKSLSLEGGPAHLHHTDMYIPNMHNIDIITPGMSFYNLNNNNKG